MRSIVHDYVVQVLDACESDRSGAVADYIPELKAADPERFGLALATLDGELYTAGHDDVEFSIQSISKPFAYALALEDAGFSQVMAHIDVEPSGNAFNSLSLKPESGRPYNPMINAGAITAHSLVAGTGDERVERILARFSALAGRELRVDEAVFESEYETGHRNLGIAHMLRASGILGEDPEQVVRGYTRQCSILVTARDLALMAATLANGGVQPVTGEQLMEPRVVRQVLSVMMSCGMYDAAGDWITNVGIPAKSGVGGGLIGALPGQVGLAAFSPRLDPHGNTVRGIEAFERSPATWGCTSWNPAFPPAASSRQRTGSSSPRAARNSRCSFRAHSGSPASSGWSGTSPGERRRGGSTSSSTVPRCSRQTGLPGPCSTSSPSDCTTTATESPC
jgi:glutaminase A